MKKQIRLAAVLLLCVMIFTACGSSNEKERFDVATDPSQFGATQVPSYATSVPEIIDFDNGDYDPSSEENVDLDESFDETYGFGESGIIPTVTPFVMNEYAGATPVIIDPIDKPTPTPAPALTFSNFTVYDATSLGISFSAPVGWVEDGTISGSYVLTNPDTSVDFQAFVQLTSRSVSSKLSESERKSEVRSVLSVLKADYTNWEPSQTAARTLFDADGTYADFTGTRKDTGAKVWGRVHVTTVNKNQITVIMVAPASYKSVYKDTVYRKLRESIKLTK